MISPTWKVFTELSHNCPWCDGLCARDPGGHPCVQCGTVHFFEEEDEEEYMSGMTITDWAAAKTIWQAIKASGLDIADELVVYVGVHRPSGELQVLVQSTDDAYDDEDDTVADQIADLQSQIENLTGLLHHD